MDFRVAAAGHCDEAHFLEQVVESADPAIAQLDLRQMRWCDPLGLVGLAVLTESWAQAGSLALASPVRRDMTSYLARMRVAAVLEQYGVSHQLPIVPERDRRRELLELTRFDDEPGSDALAALIFDRLAPVSALAARALYTAVVEIGQNVPQHSGRRWGYLAAQSTRGGRLLRFAVGDSGVGLWATLQPVGAVDDRSAIALALAGVSSVRGIGLGLPTALQQLAGLGGHLTVVTGRAAVRAQVEGGRERIAAHGVPGTLVQGTVPVG